MTIIPERTDAGSAVEGRDEQPRRLESTVVRFDGRADRRTIYPPGLERVPRMSTWLSADDDSFVDLAAVR